jgi:hypothetical protein
MVHYVHYEVESDYAPNTDRWNVVRRTEKYGRVVSSYREKRTADEVADFLTRNLENETTL